jgi:ATP-dependent Clp endopeptidase proteolytic subunit ClpP
MKLNNSMYDDEPHKEASINIGNKAESATNPDKSIYKEIDYGFSVKDSIIYIHGDIVLGLLFDFVSKVRTILENRDESQKDAPITVLLNSDGGDVYEALGIIDYIKSLPIKVNMIARGRAMSAAALMLACTTGARAASRMTSVMVHEISTANQGKASDIRANADHLESLEDLTFQLLAQHSKMDLEFWRKQARKDFYMTSSMALEYGLIDTIL